MATLLDLPDELVAVVASFAPLRAAAALTCACRSVHAALQRTQHWETRLRPHEPRNRVHALVLEQRRKHAGVTNGPSVVRDVHEWGSHASGDDVVCAELPCDVGGAAAGRRRVGGTVTCAAFVGPRGRPLLVAIGAVGVSLWQPDGERVWDAVGRVDGDALRKASCVAGDTRGRTLYVGDSLDGVSVVDVATLRPVQRVEMRAPNPWSGVQCVAVDGERVLVSGNLQLLELRDARAFDQRGLALLKALSVRPPRTTYEERHEGVPSCAFVGEHGVLYAEDDGVRFIDARRPMDVSWCWSHLEYAHVVAHSAERPGVAFVGSQGGSVDVLDVSACGGDEPRMRVMSHLVLSHSGIALGADAHKLVVLEGNKLSIWSVTDIMHACGEPPDGPQPVASARGGAAGRSTTPEPLAYGGRGTSPVTVEAAFRSEFCNSLSARGPFAAACFHTGLLLYDLRGAAAERGAGWRSANAERASL